MIRRTWGAGRATAALGLIALASPFGIVTSFSTAEAGMESAVFAMHYKPKFVASKAIPNLCDNPATPTEEPNYSPNYSNLPCGSYSTYRSPLGSGQVYVVIAKAGAEGVSAASFGVAYGGSTGQGIDPAYVTWTSCTDGLSFPNNDGVHGDFPQPGGGIRITWNNATSCQSESISNFGVHAVVGVFYVYACSDDVLRLTPNYNLQGGVPEAAVSNCAGSTTDLVQVWGLQNVLQYHMASVGFGNAWGCNPCQIDGPPCGVVPVNPTTWGRMKTMYKSSITSKGGSFLEP